MKSVSVALFAGAIACSVTQAAAAAEPAKLKEKVLYSFAGEPDGLFPYGRLIDVNGTLYGTTTGGGTAGNGTVFSLNPKTGAETVLYSFAGGADGQAPYGSLIAINGLLYGTTTNGGASNLGTAFTVDPTTGAEKVLYSFGSGTDGQNPNGSLIELNGTLYGTTSFGGTSNNGTVFTLDPTTGAEAVLYSFAGGTDGAVSRVGMIALNGTLYGTTEGGGPSNFGTVFTIDPNSGAETVLRTFAGGNSDGEYPFAGLIAVKGTLYGTTGFGGLHCESNGGDGCGTAFSVDPATGTEKLLYSFGNNATDGQNPYDPLTYVKGMLYGTTAAGGAVNNNGTVFALNPTSGVETLLYSFAGDPDGSNPRIGGLISVKGKLYGTTTMGGAFNAGTVFTLNNKKKH